MFDSEIQDDLLAEPEVLDAGFDPFAAQALAVRDTPADVEALRNFAVAQFDLAYDAVSEARAAAAKAAGGPLYWRSGTGRDGDPFSNWSNKETYMAEVTKNLDQNIWERLILTSGIEKLMDKQAHEEFRKSLVKDMPPVSADAVAATLEQLRMDARTIFLRGLANCFSGLDRRFRSHDGFKIGSRIVLTYAMDRYGSWSRYEREVEFRDVERVFRTLDGKEHVDRYGGIIGAIEKARQVAREGVKWDKAVTFVAEDDYFRVRIFGNGNMHVWFKRNDLVRRANLLLAEFYGAAVGASYDATRAPDPDRHARPEARHDRGLAKNGGFFETPEALVERVFHDYLIKPGMQVLEPNAGRGRIARHAARKGAKVTCVEINPAHAAELRDQRTHYGYTNVYCADFLQLRTRELPTFDAVFMNPPFDRGMDVDHVLHALDFLKPGGVLIAIMSAGTEFREDKQTVAFREMIKRMRGTFHDLPAGSFKESGTMVNTIVLQVTK